MPFYQAKLWEVEVSINVCDRYGSSQWGQETTLTSMGLQFHSQLSLWLTMLQWWPMLRTTTKGVSIETNLEVCHCYIIVSWEAKNPRSLHLIVLIWYYASIKWSEALSSKCMGFNKTLETRLWSIWNYFANPSCSKDQFSLFWPFKIKYDQDKLYF